MIIKVHITFAMGCVYHVKGNIFYKYPDVPGNLDDSVNGTKYVTYNSESYSYANSAWSLNSIATEIKGT